MICMYYKGIIIRQVRHLKCFACIDLKKNIDAHALDEFAGIYKATLFSRWIHDLKSCPYDQEGFIAVLLIMPKSHRSEFKKDKICTVYSI